jgi:hypothetical protein
VCLLHLNNRPLQDILFCLIYPDRCIKLFLKRWETRASWARPRHELRGPQKEAGSSWSGGPGSMPRLRSLKPSSMPRSGARRRAARSWRLSLLVAAPTCCRGCCAASPLAAVPGSAESCTGRTGIITGRRMGGRRAGIWERISRSRSESSSTLLVCYRRCRKQDNYEKRDAIGTHATCQDTNNYGSLVILGTLTSASSSTG